MPKMKSDEERKEEFREKTVSGFRLVFMLTFITLAGIAVIAGSIEWILFVIAVMMIIYVTLQL